MKEDIFTCSVCFKNEYLFCARLWHKNTQYHQCELFRPLTYLKIIFDNTSHSKFHPNKISIQFKAYVVDHLSNVLVQDNSYFIYVWDKHKNSSTAKKIYRNIWKNFSDGFTDGAANFLLFYVLTYVMNWKYQFWKLLLTLLTLLRGSTSDQMNSFTSLDNIIYIMAPFYFFPSMNFSVNYVIV